jgi:hypothetical protein
MQQSRVDGYIYLERSTSLVIIGAILTGICTGKWK